MRTTIFASFLLLLNLRPIVLHAQRLDDFRTQQALEAIQEKMHEANPDAEKKGALPESVVIDTEFRISTTSPESEVHAAVNPTDSANIVVGSMNLNPNVGLTQPIYY